MEHDQKQKEKDTPEHNPARVTSSRKSTRRNPVVKEDESSKRRREVSSSGGDSDPVDDTISWSPELFGQLLPTNVEKLLSEVEKELAYILALSKIKTGNTCWTFVRQHQMSATLRDTIEVKSKVPYFDRQKLKAILGCSKVKYDAFQRYREKVYQRLTSPAGSLPAASSEPAINTFMEGDRISNEIKELACIIVGGERTSGVPCSETDWNFVLACASQNLLRHHNDLKKGYEGSLHEETIEHLVPEAERANFITWCNTARGKRLETASLSLLVPPLRLRHFETVASNKAVYSLAWDPVEYKKLLSPAEEKAGLSEIVLELAFLMEKCTIFHGNTCWPYIEAHDKSSELEELWQKKSELESFKWHRLQHLLGRNETKLDAFRSFRLKIKSRLESLVEAPRPSELPPDDRKHVPLASLGSSSVPPAALSPKRTPEAIPYQVPVAQRAEESYTKAVYDFHHSSTVRKRAFLGLYLAQWERHLASDDRERMDLGFREGQHSQLDKFRDDEIALLHRNIIDTHLESNRSEEDKDWIRAARSFLALRERQWRAFCEELVKNWKDFASSGKDYRSFEEGQRDLWDYFNRAELSMMEQSCRSTDVEVDTQSSNRKRPASQSLEGEPSPRRTRARVAAAAADQSAPFQQSTPIAESGLSPLLYSSIRYQQILSASQQPPSRTQGLQMALDSPSHILLSTSETPRVESSALDASESSSLPVDWVVRYSTAVNEYVQSKEQRLGVLAQEIEASLDDRTVGLELVEIQMEKLRAFGLAESDFSWRHQKRCTEILQDSVADSETDKSTQARGSQRLDISHPVQPRAVGDTLPELKERTQDICYGILKS